MYGLAKVITGGLVTGQLCIIHINGDGHHGVSGRAVCHHAGNPGVVVNRVHVLSLGRKVLLLAWTSWVGAMREGMH